MPRAASKTLSNDYLDDESAYLSGVSYRLHISSYSLRHSPCKHRTGPVESMSVRPANGLLLPVATLHVMRAYTLANATINALSPVVRRVARDRTTFSNSESNRIQNAPPILTNRRFTSYRIHLSPGSRRGSRSSKRSASSTSNKRHVPEPPAADEPSEDLPPLSDPPALVPAMKVFSQEHSPSPDSPPALVQATLPSHDDSLGSMASSPETSYSSSGMSQNSLDAPPPGAPYRASTSTYQDQSEGTGFHYVSQPSEDGFSSLPPASGHTRASPPASPLSLTAAHRQLAPTAAAASSQLSFGGDSGSNAGSPPSSQRPPTPTYGYQDEATAAAAAVAAAATYPPTAPLLDTTANGHHATAAELAQSGYPPNMPLSMHNQHQHHHNPHQHHHHQQHHHQPQHHQPRYPSPPILAPIHSNRSYRTIESHNNSMLAAAATTTTQPYLHHPQPLSNEYHHVHQHHHHYQSSNEYWKADSGIRAKGIGALVQ